MWEISMADKYPFYGHDRGLDITQPRSGEFVERPMTFAELAARDAALEISRDIYRHANFAGVCYHEIWRVIAKAAAHAVDEELKFHGIATDTRG
jgi:hypothetical protein